MRLLNTSSLLLHEFYGDSIPKYAILSHRWRDSEVTFQDLSEGKGPGMSGWDKVEGCCAQAVLDGLEYAWIDSCCIDKSSSAELSEAINSMFSWYERSEVCYAYLSDVTSTNQTPHMLDTEFRNSKWFTRGWTLQELLAPCYVDFFSQNWTWVGSKSNLDDLVRDVTRIRDLWNYKDASVAQKMSWASLRETTRIEDQAYSLLGLFGVHMPPLYGEGQNAFTRLQLEILNKLDDDSLFAWKGPIPRGYSGLLAPSPNNFFPSSNIIKASIDPNRPPHIMTSKGLAVNFRLKPDGSNFVALLNCAWDLGQAVDSPVAVGLPLYLSGTNETWHRGPTFLPFQMDADTRFQLKYDAPERKIFYVPQVSAPVESTFDSIRVVWRSFSDLRFKVEDTWVKDPNEEAHWVFEETRTDIPHLSEFRENNSFASITFWNGKFGKFGLLLGISEGRLWIDLTTLQRNESLGNLELCAKSTATGQDRVSELFSEGSINVKICGTTSFSRIVEVYFDPEGNLQWPRRDTIHLSQLNNQKKLPYPNEYPSSPSPPQDSQNLPKTSSTMNFHSRTSLQKRSSEPPSLRESFPTPLRRPTPKNLGWKTNVEHLGLYTFKILRGEEPYFELKDHWTPTNQTPTKVYIDRPGEDKYFKSTTDSGWITLDQAIKREVNKDRPEYPRKEAYSCDYPDCRQRFMRAADLVVHYQLSHLHEHRGKYWCDHAKCPRFSDRFTREDHFRDHLINFHKEDIESPKTVNISLDKEKYQEEQERWLAERIINAQWWRCAKCLLKRYIAEDGWICPKCTINCEETRIRAREKLPPCSKTPPEEALTYRAKYQNCSKCNGKGLVEDENCSWVLCTTCQGDVYQKEC